MSRRVDLGDAVSHVALGGVEVPEGLTLEAITPAAALQANSYLAKHGYAKELLDEVAAKDLANAALNPNQARRIDGVSSDKVAASDFLYEPLRELHCYPPTDGACAMLLASEKKVGELADKLAWVHSVANCASDATTANLIESQITDPAEHMPAIIASKQAHERAGIVDPRKEIDYVEIYNGFAHQTLMYLEKIGICEMGEAHKLLEAGELEMDGSMPVNASGEVVSTNSIGTSALNRVTECALQIMGQAGERQVEKEVHKALAHGWGGLMQFVTITILGDMPKKA